MNTSPRTGLSHPLVIAYLDDLERALSTADAQERLDTIASVTEHLADALGGDTEPTTERVSAVLDELGSVERIAAAATPAAAPPGTPAEQAPQHQWVAPALLTASILSLLLPFFGALLAIGCIVAAAMLLRNATSHRQMLGATIAVSIVTLLITAALTAGNLAWSSFTVTGPSVSSGPVVVSTDGP